MRIAISAVGRDQAAGTRNVKTEEVRTLVLWERSHRLQPRHEGRGSPWIQILDHKSSSVVPSIVLVNIEKSAGR